VVGREEGDEPAAFGLCSPLLLTRSGVKMGKSEKGAVMLDPTMTTPYDFYQYWLNDDDELVVQHLKWLTLMTPDQVAELEAAQTAAPGDRPAQKALARDLTARVHGTAQADLQVRLADSAFSDSIPDDPSILDGLGDAVGRYEFTRSEAGLSAFEYAVASGFYPSRSEARRQVEQGGFSVNGARIRSIDDPLPDPIGERYIVLRAGKKRHRYDRLRAG
jgi:tyrosyl-tRNA synthetase